MTEVGADPGEVERVRLRRALGSFVTGVTVVTVLDDEDRPRGITANSFTSVSLSPPLILVCVDHRAASHDVFSASTSFAVNFLAHDQQDLANRFATKRPDKFDGVAFRIGATGAPVLDESLGHLECVKDSQMVIGDHTVIVGRVVHYDVRPRRPLAFHQGTYLLVDPEAELASEEDRHSVVVKWIFDVGGRVVLSRDEDTWTLPGLGISRALLEDGHLVETLRHEYGVSADQLALFSLFHDPETRKLWIVYRADVGAFAGEVPAGWTLFDEDALAWGSIAHDAVESMLRRYFYERSTAHFGIYAGSVRDGAVSALDTTGRADWKSYARQMGVSDEEVPASTPASVPTGRRSADAVQI